LKFLLGKKSQNDSKYWTGTVLLLAIYAEAPLRSWRHDRQCLRNLGT